MLKFPKNNASQENSITLQAKKFDEHLNLCRSTPEEQAHVSANVMQHEASCTPDALTPINTIPVDLKHLNAPQILLINHRHR